MTSTPTNRKPRRMLHVVLLVGLPLLAAALWAHYYRAFDPNGPVLCGFRAISGMPCPGCGITRSLSAVTHGRWALAFDSHPLGLPAAALGLVAWASAAAALAGRERLIRGVGRMAWPVVAAALAVWAVTLVRFFACEDGLAQMARNNVFARLFGGG